MLNGSAGVIGGTRRRGRLRSLTFAVLTVFMVANGALVAPVAAAANIEISITDSPDPVLSGDQLSYTITVHNPGGPSATNLFLSTQLNGIVGVGVPPLFVMTSSQGSCTQNSALVNCSGGTLGNGGDWTVTIRGRVTAASGTTINNTATVTGTKSAQTRTNSATATTLVTGPGPGGPSPDLSIGKTAPTSVAPNAVFDYILTVNNTGTAIATDVRVIDSLPAGVTIVTPATDIVATNQFVCTASTAAGPPPITTVICTGGRVNAGTNGTITITVKAPASGTLQNTSVVDPDDAIDEGAPGQDPAEFNNTSNTVTTAVTQPVAPPIAITKSGPNIIRPGDTITYTIVVTNGNAGRADYLTMVDGTQGLEASSIQVASAVATSGAKLSCGVNASKVSCSMTRLGTGSTLTVVIKGLVIASAGSSILNTATVDANIGNTGYSATATKLTTVKPGVDLTITKSDSPDPVCASSFPGGPGVCRGGLTYTFVVGNSGIDAAPNVLVRDPLPAGLVFISGSPGCSVSVSNVVTCLIASLAPESTTTLVIVLAAPAVTGSINNIVTVDPNNSIYESDETNNIASASTSVITGIDLTIAKFDSPPGSPEGFDPIATSGTQTYVIKVDNIGTQDASNIRVRDTLPAGTTFLSVTATNGFTCSQSAGIVECVGGSILGTESEIFFGAGADVATITIKVFARPTVGTMHNEVRVDPDNTIVEANESNNIATQDTTVTNGGNPIGAFNELSVTKAQTSPVGPAAVAPNGILVYTINVFNDASDPAINVRVKDFLPAGTRFIEATGDSQFLCTFAASVVDCTGGILPAHATSVGTGAATIVITVFAPGTPGAYQNQATVDPANAIPEGNETNNSASVTTNVQIGGANAYNELSIVKDDTVDPVTTSGFEMYTIDVSNSGSAPAFNVAVRDFLPAGFTFIEAADSVLDANAFFCSLGAGNVVNCTGATILAGGSRTINVKVFASAVPGNYTNQALVDPDNTIPEANETNNAASEATKVIVGPPPAPFIDLTIAKTDGVAVGAHVAPDGNVTYNLLVSNLGTNPAFQIKVRDVLPAGTTFVSATDATGGNGRFICGQSGGIVDCTGGTLDGSADLISAIGTTRTIIIVARAPHANINITNQAFVDPNNDIAEGDETNNADTVLTHVISNINLKLDKDGPNTASQGTEDDYTLTVQNTGTADAFDVVVRDPLPVGLIPLSIDTGSGNNFTCQVLQNPVNVVNCVGDLTAGQTVTIGIHVFITADGGPLDNEACVDPDNAFVETPNPPTNPTGEEDNCKTKTTVVAPPPAPDLSLNKQADPGSVSPGGNLTYTITVSNVGSADASSPVTITDSLPSSVTFVDANATNGFTCTEGGGMVTCTDPGTGLAVGGLTKITIHVTLNTNATLPVTNSASVATFGDTNPANDSDSVTTSVGGSGFDLAVNNIIDTPDPANRTKMLVYTIPVSNNGTAPANSAVVRIAMPTGASGVSIIGAAGSNGFSCGIITPTSFPFDCVGDLPAGGSTTITVTVIVLLGAPDELVLTATVDPDDAFAETDEGNNSQTATTSVSGDTCTVSPCKDLVVSQLISTPPGPVNVGDNITYTLVVTNVGNTTTDTGVGDQALVFYDIFGDFTLVSRTANPPKPPATGWTCTTFSLTAGALLSNCSGELGAGQSVILTIIVTAGAGSSGGSIQARGEADPTNTIPEFIESNNGPISVFTAVN